MTYRVGVSRRALLTRLLGAALAGLCLWLALPTHDLWWLAPLGLALFGLVTLEAGWRQGALLGLITGYAVFLPVLSWSGTYVGLVPQLALTTLEALYLAAVGGVLGGVGRRLLARGHRFAAVAALPVVWVLGEWARSTTPFGGFPWARVAFSQADGPLLAYAAWAGAPGVSFAVAAVGAGLLHAAYRLRERQWRAAPWSMAVSAILLAVATVIPLPTQGRPVTVGYVQGNVPRAGLDFNAERRAVLDNHVQGTVRLAAEIAAGQTRPDVVLWPENSSDIDPFRNDDARAQIRSAVTAVNVPLLVGAVVEVDQDHIANASLLYRPGVGIPERYDKLHPVPFAEYIPYRSFFRTFSDKVDLVRRDFVAGSSIGAFSIPSATGEFWLLPTICFEVAYDGLMRESVTSKAGDSVLVVQTNNATFGFTAESEQQLAISRLRAVEHGRAVVHISTVGVSGIVAPDGTVSQRTSLFTAQQGLAVVPARAGYTLSDRIGAAPEWLIAAAFVLLLAMALGPVRKARVVAPSVRTKERTIV